MRREIVMVYLIVGGLMMMFGVGGMETNMDASFPLVEFFVALLGVPVALHGAIKLNMEEDV
jgi:anthranilate phosphoribosyltransferase